MLIVKLRSECENKDVKIAHLQDQVRNDNRKLDELKTYYAGVEKEVKKIVGGLEAKLKKAEKELEECRPLKAKNLDLLKENTKLKNLLDIYKISESKPVQKKEQPKFV
jgi:cell shape-determining protein MreC